MSLYELFGVLPSASPATIKAEYKRRAKKLHPDQGGDAEEFQKLKDAYEVLSDPGRRKKYDETGRTAESRVTKRRIEKFIQDTMKHLIEEPQRRSAWDTPIFTDLKARILGQLMEARRVLVSDRDKTKVAIKKVTEMSRAFKTKEDYDPVGEALKLEKARLQAELLDHEDALELSQEVERIFRTYKFEVGPASEGQDRDRTHHAPKRIS